MDDCLLPLWIAATSEHSSKQIINLGGTTETSIIDAAEILSKIVGGAEIQFLEARHEVKYAFPTFKKSEELLDYKDTTLLEEGLNKMWQWAKKQPKRPRQEWLSYELEKGLYQFWK